MSGTEKYNHKVVEPAWLERWESHNAWTAPDSSSLEKCYVLEMFPYPSGNLHMGHIRNYSIGDVLARYKRMKGLNVMHPMGWDAFGLPAENAAIQHKVHPAEWTKKNIEHMRSQLKRCGFAIDWSRELATCEPEYYRWEQWLFLKMYEKGLAYRKESFENWCPSCETVLANEQVVDGLCWRCDSKVVQKKLTQWFFRITKYADELLDGLDQLSEGWPERVVTMQRNWIGRSKGCHIDFALEDASLLDGSALTVFTTRPDTLYGVSFLSIAADHPLIDELMAREPQRKDELEGFREKIRNIDQSERSSELLPKEGIDTGLRAFHPLTGNELPIWITNFVLMEYGTGAVMAVPAHDQRDFEFAQAYSLPLIRVIKPADGTQEGAGPMDVAYCEPGILINSAEFDGMESERAKGAIGEALEKAGKGRQGLTYRLRDWGISRQRYWGAPIPIIYCESCDVVPVPEEQLPVKLPKDVELSGQGASPLAKVDSFVNVACPSCGKPARREVDTMDTFVESSWYFSRYTSPHDADQMVERSIADYWLPIDQYIGGVEHAVGHLMYARFINRVMYDLGLVGVQEPFARLLTQGMVIKDGEKMSKSKGNVVDPDYLIERYGADTTRLFSLFAAPPAKDLDWNDQGVEGCYRFVLKLWRFVQEAWPLVANVELNQRSLEGWDKELIRLRRLYHQTIKKVGDDIERLHFNTSIAALMEFLGDIRSLVDEGAWSKSLATHEHGAAFLKSVLPNFVSLMAPFAPLMAEELWSRMGQSGFVSHASWPTYEEAYLETDDQLYVVQVNGKLRGRVTLPKTASKEAVEQAALDNPKVRRYLESQADQSVQRVIVVPNKLVNIVIK